MTKRPADPVLVDLQQFAGLNDALQQIALYKPFDDLAGQILSTFIGRGGGWNDILVFFGSAMSRARALFHEAIVREIEATNPHATMTLLRQFAVTVAMTFYVADHSKYVEVLMTRPGEAKKGAPSRKSVQALVNCMDATHTDQFAVVYRELCEMAHFGTIALWSSHRVRDNVDGTVGWSWSSAPEWHSENEGFGVLRAAARVERRHEFRFNRAWKGAGANGGLDKAPPVSPTYSGSSARARRRATEDVLHAIQPSVVGDRLTRVGWIFGHGGWQPPFTAEADTGAAHPYDVGPAWEGGNSFRAVFHLLRGVVTIEGHADHECCLEGFEAVPDLPSGSPWYWRIVGLPTGFRCGRAENPVLAAAAVEDILIDAGCHTFERTQTRRALP